VQTLWLVVVVVVVVVVEVGLVVVAVAVNKCYIKMAHRNENTA